jgi:hypothetical protein
VIGQAAAARRARVRALRYVVALAGGYVASGTLVIGADRMRARTLPGPGPVLAPTRPHRVAPAARISLECGHVVVRRVPAMLTPRALRHVLTYCESCAQLRPISGVAVRTGPAAVG